MKRLRARRGGRRKDSYPPGVCRSALFHRSKDRALLPEYAPCSSSSRRSEYWPPSADARRMQFRSRMVLWLVIVITLLLIFVAVDAFHVPWRQYGR
jgi:hypothetical protein